MLQELNFEEIKSINGGEATPYSVGHDVGKAVAAFFTAYGIYALFI
jgi:hypothetical protein